MPSSGVLPARFSHKLHLDRGRMETAVGFHDGCEDCHAPGPEGGGHRTLATHDACARCHDSGKLALKMSDCTGCHSGTVPLERGRELIHGDLTFSHAAHQADRVGRQYACRYCHEDTDDWTTVFDRKPPDMTRLPTSSARDPRWSRY